MTNFFQVKKKSQLSNGRLGLITTAHGKINTPAFIFCGTKATVKSVGSIDNSGKKDLVFFDNKESKLKVIKDFDEDNDLSLIHI